VVAIKPAKFDENFPTAWFAILEAQFNIAGVTVSVTKFYHALSHLPTKTVSSLNPDIITAMVKIEATINTLSTPVKIIDRNGLENAKRKIAIASQAAFWESLDDEELKSVLAEFVEKVEVDLEGAVTPSFRLP
ncbi:MAG: hypothetical protein HC787_05670, partial [Nostocaceae cyanobacterium CSU_2_110]|nr:hypothetical protein [Nostocaceae cyanobacterium CSU_2_110]